MSKYSISDLKHGQVGIVKSLFSQNGKKYGCIQFENDSELNILLDRKWTPNEINAEINIIITEQSLIYASNAPCFASKDDITIGDIGFIKNIKNHPSGLKYAQIKLNKTLHNIVLDKKINNPEIGMLCRVISGFTGQIYLTDSFEPMPLSDETTYGIIHKITRKYTNPTTCIVVVLDLKTKNYYEIMMGISQNIRILDLYNLIIQIYAMNTLNTTNTHKMTGSIGYDYVISLDNLEKHAEFEEVFEKINGLKATFKNSDKTYIVNYDEEVGVYQFWDETYKKEETKFELNLNEFPEINRNSENETESIKERECDSLLNESQSSIDADTSEFNFRNNLTNLNWDTDTENSPKKKLTFSKSLDLSEQVDEPVNEQDQEETGEEEQEHVNEDVHVDEQEDEHVDPHEQEDEQEDPHEQENEQEYEQEYEQDYKQEDDQEHEHDYEQEHYVDHQQEITHGQDNLQVQVETQEHLYVDIPEDKQQLNQQQINQQQINQPQINQPQINQPQNEHNVNSNQDNQYQYSYPQLIPFIPMQCPQMQTMVLNNPQNIISIEQWLSQINQDLNKYSKTFINFGYTNIGYLQNAPLDEFEECLEQINIDNQKLGGLKKPQKRLLLSAFNSIQMN
jgi:hypothetical protein